VQIDALADEGDLHSARKKSHVTAATSVHILEGHFEIEANVPKSKKMDSRRHKNTIS